ncbi:MAG: hypothetical protein CMO55_12050 [Verrucomicrobiales bacterium]|nr:hypothetical protein [Verrucomicrobiales bacterium]
MTEDLDPIPSETVRALMASRVRDEASDTSRERVSARTQENNGEAKQALATPPDGDGWVSAFGTFSKSLEHDDFGRVKQEDLRTFISEINQDKPGSSLGETPLPGTYSSRLPAPFAVEKFSGEFHWPQTGNEARNYESPLCGHTLELEGPDPDQVAMPPAPKLGSAELIAEIAEVYAQAYLRDVPFALWEEDPEKFNGISSEEADYDLSKIDAVINALNELPFFKSEEGLDERAKRRRRARLMGEEKLTRKNLFRGSTPGAHNGPYLSQFMLIGNEEIKGQSVKDALSPSSLAGKEAISAIESLSEDALNRAGQFCDSKTLKTLRDSDSEHPDKIAHDGPAIHTDGLIRYGVQVINQRVIPHQPFRDHMTNLVSWLDVQNGSNRKNFDLFLKDGDGGGKSRFITTPRDLATYVHFDQLYQAYLNACLILLGQDAATDIGMPEGKGHPTRDGFATFGGPHILTLVCEVATRALKAVRRQKYNIHLRSRPEALAEAVTLAWNGEAALGHVQDEVGKMFTDLNATEFLDQISKHNGEQNSKWRDDLQGNPDLEELLDNRWIQEEKNGLLPMAFPEGSPLHPSYGAGHATVAGACVTILKAFFEMNKVTDGSLFEEGKVERGKLNLKEYIETTGPYNCPESLFGDEIILKNKDPESSAPKATIDTAYQADPGASCDCSGQQWEVGQILVKAKESGLSIQGELDKLAANISIGRNFAGVHYYTDYYESLRMGERVAVGILQEQMLTYREPVSMRFTSFDGDRILIVGSGGSRGLDDAKVFVWPEGESKTTDQVFKDWWNR